MKALSLPLGLLLLTSCPLNYEAPRPPSWSEECQPDSSYYLDLAASTENLGTKGSEISDPAESLAQAQSTIRKMGVELEYKADGSEAWENFNTAFPRVIYLSKYFDDRPDADKAMVLWHEVIHLRQYKAMKPAVFYQHYVFAEGRWALEVQAYREMFRVMKALGMGEQDIKSRMRPRAELLYSSYDLSAMPESCAVGLAVEIWSQDF